MQNLYADPKLVPLWIRLPLLFAALGLSAYWILTESGVFFWIADLQAGYFDGEHYIVLSGLIAILVPLIPAVIIVQGLAQYYAKQEPQQ